MDWREFTLEVLQELAPPRMLASKLRLTDEGYECAGTHGRWKDFGSIQVIAAGKPAAAQAGALMELLRVHPPAAVRLKRALAVTREGYGSSSADVEVIHSSHPIPDESSLEAGERVLMALAGLGSRDLAVFLISGGASSLVESLRPPHTLEDLRTLNERLLRSGASISEINSERRKLSRLKGGGWVAHCGASRILNLVSADVPSGDPAVVGSGPAVSEPAVTEILCDGRDLIGAALRRLRVRGIEVTGDSPILDCSAEQAVGWTLKTLDNALSRGMEPPFAIVSGGEAPVRVSGHGKGGRNTEFVLRAAEALWIRGAVDARGSKITVAAIASDGVDGPTDCAGGWLSEAQIKGREARARECLGRNDSLAFLQECGTALITGPTQVNLMDLRVVLVER